MCVLCVGGGVCVCVVCVLRRYWAGVGVCVRVCACVCVCVRVCLWALVACQCVRIEG